MNPEQDEKSQGGKNTDSPTPQVFGPQQTGSDSIGSPNITPEFQASLRMTPAPNNAPQPLSTAPKRKKPGKKLLAIVAAVILIGLGAGAYAYVTILNNSPEKVLADALSGTMKDVLGRKPVRLAGTITYESKEEGSPYSVIIDMGASQADDNGQLGATVRIKAGDEIELSVKGSLIAEGSETVYVKIDDVQKTVDDIIAISPEFSSVAETAKPLIKKIDGRWVKIDQKSLAEMGFAESEEMLDKCSEEVGKLRISEADQKQVKEIFTQNQFAIVSEELPAETVDGDSSFHYKLNLNEEAGLRFTKDFIELESFAGVKKACEIESEDIDKDLEELKKQTDEEVEAKPVFELWVSEKTRRPTKFKVTLDDKKFSMENISTIKINADDVKIDIPTDSMTLQQLQTEIEQTFGSTSTLGWNDLRKEIR